MDEDSRRLIEAWLHVAEKEAPGLNPPLDSFFRFMALWVAFNAYLTRRYPCPSGDHNKVREFARDESIVEFHQYCLRDQDYKTAVQRFRQGVRDMHARRDDIYYVNSPTCFTEVMECVYHVRCNLFHGDKEVASERDRVLVEAAYRIVMDHLKRLLKQSRE